MRPNNDHPLCPICPVCSQPGQAVKKYVGQDGKSLDLTCGALEKSDKPFQSLSSARRPKL